MGNTREFFLLPGLAQRGLKWLPFAMHFPFDMQLDDWERSFLALRDKPTKYRKSDSWTAMISRKDLDQKGGMWKWIKETSFKIQSVRKKEDFLPPRQQQVALTCSQWEAVTTSDSHFPPMHVCSEWPLQLPPFSYRMMFSPWVSRLACGPPGFVCPKLQFLCSFWTNSFAAQQPLLFNF